MKKNFLKNYIDEKKREISEINQKIKDLQYVAEGLQSRLNNLENAKSQVKENHKWFEVKKKIDDKNDIKDQISEVKRTLAETKEKIKDLEAEKSSIKKKNTAVPLACVTGILLIALIGKGIASDGNTQDYETTKAYETTSVVQSLYNEDESIIETTSEQITTTKVTVISTENNTDVKSTSKKDSTKKVITSTTGKTKKNNGDSGALPTYTGSPYTEINNNVPTFSKKDKSSTSSFERYSDLDSLGRCGVAYANVCVEIMPTEERGTIGQVKPSGWQTVKYDIVDGKYLYNRCHLIGYQLSAENANEKNLITGTRYLNIQGMLPFENMVADYVKETYNHVLYRVTPVFVGNELVARGVKIEAYSVEDDGDGICFNVYCFNVQPGVTIDYSNGGSALSGQTPTTNSTAKSTAKSTTTKSTTKSATTTKKVTTTTKKSVDTTSHYTNNDSSRTVYITNTGDKYHGEGCRYLKSKIAISESEAKSKGYVACSHCGGY